MEAGDNPQWMFYEPLLNGASATYIDGVDYNLSISAEAVFVGKCIDHAVESNATHVWFNLVFDGAYAPFLQILTQPWSSILSKSFTPLLTLILFFNTRHLYNYVPPRKVVCDVKMARCERERAVWKNSMLLWWARALRAPPALRCSPRAATRSI
jgi:hypothetical protein